MPAESIEKIFHSKGPPRLSAALISDLSLGARAPKEKPALPAVPAPEAPAAAPENLPHPVMDRRALDLLKRMNDILASARSITYRSGSSVEMPAATGQFPTFFGHTGSPEVNGHPTEHLAFMGPGVNWEIWIDSGKEALPRRFAVTYKEAVNFPRFRVEFFDWKLNPRLPAATFAFQAPKGAKQIEFASELGQEFKKPPQESRK